MKKFFQEWLLKDGNFITAFFFTAFIYILVSFDWYILENGEGLGISETTFVNIIYVYMVSVILLMPLAYTLYDSKSYVVSDKKFKVFISRIWNPFLNVGMIINAIFIFIGYLISPTQGAYGKFIDWTTNLIYKQKG